MTSAARAAVYNVTCTNSIAGTTSDVATINSAIALAAQAGASAGGVGAIVQLAPGTCAVGGASIELQSNVWLRGSGTRATIMKQRAFSNSPLIQANNVYINQPAGLQNVKITDMTIDGGDFVSIPLSVGQASPSGSSTLTFTAIPPSVVPQMIIRDITHPDSLPDDTTVQSISSDGTQIVMSAPNPAFAGVSMGDTLSFYSSTANLDAEFVNGLKVDKVYLTHASGVAGFLIQDDTNFVVSNSEIMVSRPDPEAIGGFFVSGSDGFIFRNWLYNTSMALGVTHVVTADNLIHPGYGTGIVSAPWTPKGTPLPQYNIFEHNTVYGSQTGLNHDGIVAGGLEIWDSNSLISGNFAFNNGGQGIFSGGPNNVISNNAAFDNGQSKLFPNGFAGIEIQAGANVPVNTKVVGNVSCNSKSGMNFDSEHFCMAGQNTGSQTRALYIGPGTSATNIAPNNEFEAGSVGNQPIAGAYNPAPLLAQGSITGTPCILLQVPGSCATTLTWNTTNAKNVTIWAVDSSNPSVFVQVATNSAATGSQTIPGLKERVYTFVLECDTGMLSSWTMQPGKPH